MLVGLTPPKFLPVSVVVLKLSSSIHININVKNLLVFVSCHMASFKKHIHYADHVLLLLWQLSINHKHTSCLYF